MNSSDVCTLGFFKLLSRHVLSLSVVFAAPLAVVEARPQATSTQRYSLALGGSAQLEQDDKSDFLTSSRVPVLLHFGTNRVDFDMIYSNQVEQSKLSVYQISATTHHIELGARYSWKLFHLGDGIPLSFYSGALVDLNWTSVATSDSRESRQENSTMNTDIGLSAGIESRKSFLFFRPELFVLHRQASAPSWTAGARAFLGLHWEI